MSWSLQRSILKEQKKLHFNDCRLPLQLKKKGVFLFFLLLELQVIRPLPSPRQVQSSIIQPWYCFSQVSPTTYEDAALFS